MRRWTSRQQLTQMKIGTSVPLSNAKHKLCRKLCTRRLQSRLIEAFRERARNRGVKLSNHVFQRTCQTAGRLAPAIRQRGLKALQATRKGLLKALKRRYRGILQVLLVNIHRAVWHHRTADVRVSKHSVPVYSTYSSDTQPTGTGAGRGRGHF